MRTRHWIFIGLWLAGLAFLAQPTALQSAEFPSPFLQEHALPGQPRNLVVASAGLVWFTLPEANAIGSLRVTDTTTVTLYALPTANSHPYDLAYANGLLWFTERTGNRIGRLDVQHGTIQEFTIPTANSEPTGIAVAPDGQIWFTERQGNRIGRFDPPTQQFTEYLYPTPNAQFEDLVVYDDQTIWATAPNLDQIVRLQVTDESFAFFAESTAPYEQPTGLVLAGNQQLWVTASASDVLLRYAPGTLTLWTPYALPPGSWGPIMLAHRNLGDIWEFWFTAQPAGRIGRLQVRPNGTLLDLRDQPLRSVASQPWGVAVDEAGYVWVAAGGANAITQWQPPYFAPLQGEGGLLLPLILHNKCFQAKTATPFGVQLYGATGNASPYHALLVESGAHWVRTELAWAAVEPTNREPSAFAWSSADQAVGATTEECFNLVLTILDNPAWAATRVGGPIDRVSVAEFVKFVGAVVERYDGDGQADAPGSPVVHYFELYNEPDGNSFAPDGRWGHAGPAYAAMLAAVYPAVKAANPQAQVVFGGIAYDAFLEDGGWFVRTFLDVVLQAGGGAHFDYMNFHYYPAFAGSWTTGKGPGLKEKVAAVRAKLMDYGVDKPILITETGWTHVGENNDEIQSRYVVALYTQSLAANVAVTFWWTLVDVHGTNWNTGLATDTDPPVKKPAFAVYQRMVEELAQAQFVPTLPLPATNHPDVEVYPFHAGANGQLLYVAWVNPVDANVWGEVQIPAARVSVHDLQGALRTL
jgi:streptogramin lyase